MRLALAIVALTGCRFEFDPVTVASDASAGGDTSVDAFDVCAQPTTLVCDDFSAAPPMMFGTAQWLASSGRSGGALEISGTAAMGGSSYYQFATQTSGSLYARTYANVQPGVAITSFAVVVEVNNAVVTGGSEKVSADIYSGDLWGIGAPYSGGGPGSTAQVARAAWVCVELRIDISSTAGAFFLSIDGTEVTSSTNIDTLIPTGYKQALLSASVDVTDPDITVLFDDLVIALAPIGC